MKGHVLSKIFQNSCVSNIYCSVHGIMVLKKTSQPVCFVLSLPQDDNQNQCDFFSHFDQVLSLNSFSLFWVMVKLFNFQCFFFFFKWNFFLHQSLFLEDEFSFIRSFFLSFFLKAMCVNPLYFSSEFKCRFIMNLSLLRVPFVFIGYTCISLYF